jgi:cell division septation protein DedD
MGDLAALDAQRAQATRAAAAKTETKSAPVVAAQPQSPDTRDVTPPGQAAVHVEPAAQREMPAPPTVMTVVPTDSGDLPAPPRNVGKYTVQLGASQHRTEALQLASRASTTGQKAYVVEARLPGKGVWYRVRVGAFPDKPAAERFRRDIERELRMDAVVMPTR